MTTPHAPNDQAITDCAIRIQQAINELIQVHSFTAFDALTHCVEWFNAGREDPDAASETITVGRILFTG